MSLQVLPPKEHEGLMSDPPHEEEKSDRPTVAETSDDGELVMLGVRVPRTMRRRLRIAAAREDLNIQQLVTEALEKHLQARNF